jgi:hypothetical protein
MKTISLAILALVLLVPICGADAADKKHPSPVAKADEQQSGNKIVLKNKSSFVLDANTRNPFWPIGWKPAAKLAEPGAEHAGPDIPVAAFVVSSITIEQGTRFAIINGKVMQEGQQFGLQLGNQTYQITLKAIEDGRVVLARRDQEIVVGLRRK